MLDKNIGSGLEGPTIPLIRFYACDGTRHEFSRSEFCALARRAAFLLREGGLGCNDCFILGFGENRVEDLAFRFGASLIGAVPVTINWQADSFQRILRKIEKTKSPIWVGHSSFSSDLKHRVFCNTPTLKYVDSQQVWDVEGGEVVASESPLFKDSNRLILFTSGTTGEPKGVVHSCEAYQKHGELLESFLASDGFRNLSVIVVNPLHHANSSAICDWALQRADTIIELFPKYSRRYWDILRGLSNRDRKRRVIAPLVSKHFDLLESLIQENYFSCSIQSLKSDLSRIQFLLGSSPVGPTTIKRLVRFTGKIPIVRFGSTELCLQVLGIPLVQSQKSRLASFRRGWERSQNGFNPGYYIGRPHPGFTEVRIVGSAKLSSPRYMVECDIGEPGYLIVKSVSAMAKYLGDPVATAKVWGDDWYLGLNDLCFSLENTDDGELDYYWVARACTILIKGGANYSCEQVAQSIKDVICEGQGLEATELELAVVALKVTSEHEDSCCLMIELKSPRARSTQISIEKQLKEPRFAQLNKVMAPDYFRFGSIPRNFKGALQTEILVKRFASLRSDVWEG